MIFRSSISKMVVFVFLIFGIQQVAHSFSVHDSLKKMIPSLFKQQPLRAPRIALITINDDINFFQVSQHLVDIAKNPTFDGAILIINNNGGSLGSFSVIHDLIKKVSKTKPIVAVVGQGALSCGYLIASVTQYIFAHTLSDIGGIGVILQVNRYKQMKIKENDLEADMQVNLLYAGEFKVDTHVFAKDLSDEQKKGLQDNLNFSYNQIVTMVAENRNLKRDAYKEWAEGKKFLAPRALELGLIDQIGTIFDAEEKVREFVVKKNPQAVYGPGVTVINL